MEIDLNEIENELTYIESEIKDCLDLIKKAIAEVYKTDE